MKTFLDFTQTVDLSGVRLVGYAGDNEVSISLKTLAAAINTYIQQTKTQTPMIYRFDAQTSTTINNPNTTYGIYLSSSVEQFDIELQNNSWLTLTKEGNCYDITTYTDVLSVNKTSLCPGDWVYIKNTALSSTHSLYFQQTGSAIMKLDPMVVEGDRPVGFFGDKIKSIIANIAINAGIRTFNWLVGGQKDTVIGLIDTLMTPEGSDNVPNISEECEDYQRELNSLKNKLNNAYNDLFNYTDFGDWGDKATAFQKALNAAAMVAWSASDPTPCGGDGYLGISELPNREEVRNQYLEVLKLNEKLVNGEEFTEEERQRILDLVGI